MGTGKKNWRRVKGYKCPLMTPFAIMYFQLFVGDPTLSE